MDEPLLACHPLRHVAWPDDFADSSRHLSTFEIRFDFIDHELRIVKSDGAAASVETAPAIGGEILPEVMNALSRAGIACDHQHHA